MPAPRRFPDPEMHSAHWCKCDDPNCWLCNPEGAVGRLVQIAKESVDDEEERERQEMATLLPRLRPTILPRHIETFESALDKVYAMCRKVMILRHRKYGPGNINAFGKMGVLVRLSDKVERLKTLLARGRGADAADESEVDTWMDVVNYGVIGLLVLMDQWGMPMEEEVDPAQKEQAE